MRKFKQRAVDLLRKLHLLSLAEWGRLGWVILQERADNARFLREHPGVILPPLALMHDAFSTTSYRSYWGGGQSHAQMIAGLIRKHHAGAKSVLEWGCGPARILRHLRTELPGATLYGADYNPRSIAWCQQNIEGITFGCNGLAPPLPFAEKFDIIYAVSVLTHLSQEQQNAWMAELKSKLNPGGMLIMTTHGESSAKRTLPHEYAQFLKEGIVIRGGVREGKRCYVSYHHPDYARRQLFSGMQLREHISEGAAGQQDIWIVQSSEQAGSRYGT